MQQALSVVQKDCRKTVSVLQYNILASYLGENTKPWFLFGAKLDSETRERVFEKFYKRDGSGKPLHGWPSYAGGILTPQQINEVERQNEHFKWDNRGQKIVEQLLGYDADVWSLVENDQQQFFADRVKHEWDSVFHKRPRQASLDGCSIFWRRSKFQLIESYAMDLIDGSDGKGRIQRDRSCLLVLLRWIAHGKPLVIVSTHLAKDPENRAQTATRVRQVAQIMEQLTEFTKKHQAYDAPVILMGDLNAKHFGEIRGIAQTVWQIKGSPIHKFLWSASDVPTGPTSVTEARNLRIDVVQFLSSQLEILEVAPVPTLPRGEVIPNEKHPSDHFPVCVTFCMKDSYTMHKECARAWLECVAGREKVHPLTESELKTAFEFFDRDRNQLLQRHDLEEACVDLGVSTNFHADVQDMLLDCFPEHQIDYENFLRAYEARLNHERMRCIGDLEYAFQYFAHGSGQIQVSTLETAFREICPISFSDDEVKEMIRRLNLADGQEQVDLRSFCQVVANASFPHRDRRKFTKVAGIADASSNSELFRDRHSSDREMSRQSLSMNLQRMSNMIRSGSVDTISPRSPSHISPPQQHPNALF
jgi:Ca2+-binding EF-hand superfamily protein/endonuclease/exonuclease/phosphatase family metal-dependent hydrolase